MPDTVSFKKINLVSFAVGCVVATTFVVVLKESIMLPARPLSFDPEVKSFQVEGKEEDVILKQRNDLSKTLNERNKQLGQASCKMLTLRRKAGEKIAEDVSVNGGWCAELSGSNSKSHRFDEGFAKELSRLLKGKHIASFGDGPGDYKKALDSYKEVSSYTAYDGAPFCEKTTDGKVQFLDLSGPQYGMTAFDWVVSVEVGEHIPAKFEDIYLDNLARHAKEGIILSWAVPGQGGLSHVNNRPLEHVVQQMKSRGFDINKQGGEPLRNASKYHWLKANIHVYRRIDPSSFNHKDV